VASLQRSVSKTTRKLSNWLNNRPVLLIYLGLLIFFVGAFRYYQIRILSFTKPVASAKTVMVGELPTKIMIPSIGVDLPIDLGEIKNGVWQISYNNPTFLNTSARPGTGGNIVIYGHNKKIIFGNLPYLGIGQKIFIKTVSGKIYTYIAYQKDFVGSDRVDLVSPTKKEELTIYTCWGIFDTQRAVVKAKPI
jgi:LPXTG-site transpeptidase (sortase) family protein